MASYRPNRVGFAKMMKTRGVRRLVTRTAEDGARRLRATAPRQTGEYASHIHVTTGLDIRRHDRPAAFIVNDADYATVLEVGSHRIKNPPMPMIKLLDQMRM